MDSDSITIIAVFFILLILSAYFSSTETAFSSLSRVRLKNMAEDGNKKAHLTLRLEEDYDRILSTILIGNNLVNILLSSLATLVFVGMFGNAGVTISTIVVTVVVLIFGEVTPKSLAKERPEKFAIFASPFLRVLMVILNPINCLFVLWKKLLAKIFRMEDTEGISEQELLTIVDVAQQDGGIDEQEGELIRNVIEFNDTEVEDILTPRVQLVAIDLDTAGQEEIAEAFRDSGFSRLPVYRKNIDNILGVINVKDFYTQIYGAGADKNAVSVESIVNPVACVPPTMKISKLLGKLQSSKSHLVTVSDEYGGIIGIVTLEDVLEELVGEIWDEHDRVVEGFVPAGSDTYKVLGMADLDDMFDLFGLDYDIDIATVGGWAMDELEKIPETGDHFVFGPLDITVTKADERKAEELLIRKLPEEETK